MVDSRFDSRLTRQQKTHYTNLWCREQGIHSRDLDNHPTIDDAIILIQIRNDFWVDLDSEERALWTRYWNLVYNNQAPLKANWLIRLEAMVRSAEFKRQKQAQRRATIQAMRAKAKK